MSSSAMLLTIARDEARYWMRSRLAAAAGAVLAVLLVLTTLVTALRMEQARHERLHHQSEAEEAFFSQPDRHPHRMVHYGHYVFRTPPPLAVLDPGLDPVTGQSIFLEGHRRNSATFAAAGASADLGGPPLLTPALAYQLFAPLLIILLGHSAVAREREAATLAVLLAQGVDGRQLLAGKALALTGVVAVLLLPLVALGAVALLSGEAVLAVAATLVVYAVYLMFWAGATLLASSVLRQRSVLLAVLLASWLWITLVAPALAASAAAAVRPITGKVASDIALQEALRDLGDGHNAADPGFAQLRAELLAQYDAERVEDLPVNIRGVVAQAAEAGQSEVMERFAEARMDEEARQADLLAGFGWLSPRLAASFASRALAGSDLEAHHRFQREAEAVRLDFVQGLNRVHAEQLTYADDVARSRDAEAERRTRVSADNWQVLDRFRFAPAPAAARLANAAPSAFMLVVWSGLIALGGVLAGRRLTL